MTISAKPEDEPTATLRRQLLADGVLQNASATMTPLTGGVSSNIFLLEGDERPFVVKQARHKLDVADDWYADPIRNHYEQLYMRYVSQFAPGVVPKVIATGDGYFAMEYLSGGLRNFKSVLIEGDVRNAHARLAGELLGKIHAHSQDDAVAATQFDTTANFHELRTDPYLLTVARRYPEYGDAICDEANRLDRTRECLVHGDFSPKNMLLDGKKLTLVDCEVAWYGDPAFDLAFFLTHLLLKSLYHAPRDMKFSAMIGAFLSAYATSCGIDKNGQAKRDARAAKLLTYLLLARIDGKSPVEYLSEPKRDHVRRFVRNEFATNSCGSTTDVSAHWFSTLSTTWGD